MAKRLNQAEKNLINKFLDLAKDAITAAQRMDVDTINWVENDCLDMVAAIRQYYAKSRSPIARVGQKA